MGFGFEVVVIAFVWNKILCLARSEGRYARNAKQISAALEVFVRVWGWVFWYNCVESLSSETRDATWLLYTYIQQRKVTR